LGTIKQQFAKHFLSPQGTLSKRVDTFFIFLCVFGNLVAFYGIEFVACAEFDCNKLEIMNIWYKFSGAYLILALCCLGIGIYFCRSNPVEKIYIWSLTTLIGVTHIMLWLIPFGIANEVSQNL